MPVSGGELLSFDDKYRAGGGGKKGAKGGSGIAKGGMASLTRRIPAPISDVLTMRIQDHAQRAFEAIGGHGIARVDCLLDADGETVYVNEINTMPGSLSFYLWEASGLAFDRLVRTMVESAFERHRARRETQFSLDVNLLAGARG
jgi:D-alanine-D-alanine ligase